MTSDPFSLPFDALPKTLPIFPLTGVLLLPRGKLPLNIFEPRYLNMVRDALAADRLIGMIQPTDGSGPEGLTPEDDEERPAVYETGCAGRITSFSETDDGRILLTLTGACRFHAGAELPSVGGYRRVQVDWEPFRADLAEEDEAAIDRTRLLDGLRRYFKKEGMSANWDAIEQTPDQPLVTTLAMICPFEPREKQALLESPTFAERAALMMTMIEMAAMNDDSPLSAAKH